MTLILFIEVTYGNLSESRAHDIFIIYYSYTVYHENFLRVFARISYFLQEISPFIFITLF
nr:MAG TPA: hypothetical protein [Caudoviricetes sp.]